MTLSPEYDKRLISIYQGAACVLGSVVAVLGLLLCIGRVSDISFLSHVSGGTATTFLLAGLATALMAKPPRTVNKVAGRLLSLLAGSLCILNGAHWFFHCELISEIAQLPWIPAEAQCLFAQGQNDSVQMTLLAVSLMLLHVPPLRREPEFAASDLPIIFATLISLMTLLGLIFGVPNFCMFVSCLRISWLGGIGFALLCLALVFATTDRGVFTMLSRKDAGGVLARRLLPAVVLLPLALGWLRMQGQSLKAFDGETGLAIMIVAMITLTMVIIWSTSWSLGQADRARQLALTNLEQSEKRARMIVEQAIDAFIAIDSRGTIRDWNFRAEETFGWLRAEAIGKEPSTTLVPAGQDLLLQLLATEEATAPNKPVETLMQHKAGHTFPAELSLFTVVVDNEKIRCAFVRDITESKELEQRLRDFYSTVAHELRSPLTSIRCCLSMVKEVDSNLPDTLREGIVVADSSVGRLMRLINDLLDVKRIEEGKLDLELEHVESIILVMQAAEELRGMASSCDVEIIPVVEREGIVLADSDRVMQVLTNLVSNAIKYSPADSYVVIKSGAGAPGFLRFSVIDSGPGIPADQLHKLFTRFGQTSQKSERTMASSGLGLVISKSIVEQHGGKIGLDTVAGEGSTFWFELPLVPGSGGLHLSSGDAMQELAQPPQEETQRMAGSLQ